MGLGTLTFHPEIVSLSTTQPALSSLATSGMVIGSVVEIVIPVAPSNTMVDQKWQLTAGTANPADAGNVAPADFDAISNTVFWGRVG
jgi:hypothetical protein